jgi:peptide/nickel transport system substrate-binding protein
MFKSGTDIQSLTLEKNKSYYGIPAFLDKLTFKFFYSYNETFEALRTNNILAISFLPEDLQKKINSSKFNNYKIKLPQYTALFFNETKQKNLEDKEFKKALALAIDKESILKNALNGNGEVVHSPILSGNVGYYPEIEKIAFDPIKANEVLDKNWSRINPEEYFKLQNEAVMKDRMEQLELMPDWETNSTTLTADAQTEVENLVRQGMRPDQFFYRKNKDGEVLSLFITTAENSEYQQVAETIARFWRDIGIQTNIQLIDGKQINKLVIKERKYEILLYGEILGSDPDPYPFWHSSQANYPGLNLSMYTSRVADKYLEEARISTDETVREENYKKFQDLLVTDLPAIFLYAPTYNFTADDSIKGIELNKIINPSDRYNELYKWYIKTKWGWK